MHIIQGENIFTYIEYTPIYKGINVTEFGKELSPRTTGNLCYRPNYIVHFVLDGEGRFTHDGMTNILSKGKAFVITPEKLIRYVAAEKTGWTYCWFALSGTDCATLFKQSGLSAQAVFDYDEEDIRPLLDLIEEVQNNKSPNESVLALKTNAVVFEVLKNCAQKLKTENPKPQNLSTSIIDVAVAYMQSNLHKPLNVSLICKELNISRTYFSTLFESTMRIPPYQFLQNLRIQRACELLLSDRNLRIYEVAEMVGFSSVAQFCKCFQKINAAKPTAYRKSYSKPNNQPNTP